MDDKIITVQCQGCEAECEVSISVKAGQLTCIGGNNCPTGEAFALSMVRNMLSSQ